MTRIVQLTAPATILQASPPGKVSFVLNAVNIACAARGGRVGRCTAQGESRPSMQSMASGRATVVLEYDAIGENPESAAGVVMRNSRRSPVDVHKRRPEHR